MNTQSERPSAAELLREADARVSQALENFFQRRHAPIQDAILRTLSAQITPSSIATGQACLDWLNAYPEALSSAFADQFRRQLDRPETFARDPDEHPSELQLVDDDTFRRQLEEEKAVAHLTETLRADMLLLFGRMQALRRAVLEDETHASAYGPQPIIRALSRALDALGIDSTSGTLMLQCAVAPLLDTLKHTYTALNQFLGAQDIPALPQPHTTRAPRRREAGAGPDILGHIRSAAARAVEPEPTGGPSALPTELSDMLKAWQGRLPPVSNTQSPTSAQLLRQLHEDALHAGTGAADLALLDAVADLFDFILDDPGVSLRYKAVIAHLQIPVLRVALVAPHFFSDDQHPARQVIDLLGLFSRRFPEHAPAHGAALEQVESTCAAILHDPGHPAEAFAEAQRTLAGWLAGEDARMEAGLAVEVAQLERIEREERGTLLALDNLQDLAERYPAPESVLRRLEAAWVPYMASLYVAESGEGPDWRAACLTLVQLFLSLQAPDSDPAREARLQTIPHINAALRSGLLAQGATSAQLKDFFGAITVTQEGWIRPAAAGPREAAVSAFTPRHIAREQIESLARQTHNAPPRDPVLQQAEQLLEGDWVDFDPPYEGLTTARVAWVGTHGYLLFCDSDGDQRFSLDCARLALEIRAGRAQIPEHSLTRKAMLRLKSKLENVPA